MGGSSKGVSGCRSRIFWAAMAGGVFAAAGLFLLLVLVPVTRLASFLSVLTNRLFLGLELLGGASFVAGTSKRLFWLLVSLKLVTLVSNIGSGPGDTACLCPSRSLYFVFRLLFPTKEAPAFKRPPRFFVFLVKNWFVCSSLLAAVQPTR